jgi:hypothetical protein
MRSGNRQARAVGIAGMAGRCWKPLIQQAADRIRD